MVGAASVRRSLVLQTTDSLQAVSDADETRFIDRVGGVAAKTNQEHVMPLCRGVGTPGGAERLYPSRALVSEPSACIRAERLFPRLPPARHLGGLAHEHASTLVSQQNGTPRTTRGCTEPCVARVVVRRQSPQLPRRNPMWRARSHSEQPSWRMDRLAPTASRDAGSSMAGAESLPTTHRRDVSGDGY